MGLLVFVVVVALVAIAIWASKRVPHPEQASGHSGDENTDTTSERFYRTADRPAGPDAEDPVGPDDIRDPGAPTEPPP